jgi:glycosyltransferase involved in cell wall biosynthesis
LWHSPDFLVPPLRQARAVVTVHDLSFLVHPERADPALARFLGAAVPRAVGRAAQVLADSQHTAQDLMTYLDVPAEQLTVAYPGIGPEFRHDLPPEQLTALRDRLSLARPYILGVGTLEPRKDWPLLMAAFTGAGSALAGHDLVLAGGEGWGVAPILAAAREAGPRVRLLGFVPEAELPALMRAADAFAYPSVYEGFGLPPLEAMACATPTLVSDASCLPEVVGDAALVLPVGDVNAWSEGLVAAVGDGALRRRLAAEGPRRAARFTWDDCAATVEEVFRQSLPPATPH